MLTIKLWHTINRKMYFFNHCRCWISLYHYYRSKRLYAHEKSSSTDRYRVKCRPASSHKMLCATTREHICTVTDVPLTTTSTSLSSLANPDNHPDKSRRLPFFWTTLCGHVTKDQSMRHEQTIVLGFKESCWKGLNQLGGSYCGLSICPHSSWLQQTRNPV